MRKMPMVTSGGRFADGRREGCIKTFAPGRMEKIVSRLEGGGGGRGEFLSDGLDREERTAIAEPGELA